MQPIRELAVIEPPARFAYLKGCDQCKFGRLFIVPIADAWRRYPLAVALPDLLLFMFRDGLYAHCECDAGQAAARSLERIGERLKKEQVKLKADIAMAQQARLTRIFDDARVPRRFADLTCDGFKAIAGRDPGKRTAIQAIDAYLVQGHVNTPRGKRYGIVLWGRSDMGKTGCLSPLFLHYVRGGRAGLWVQYNDLLAALRDFEGGQVEERISAAKRTEFLFIDDFGDPAAERSATDYARDVMFRILDHRNNYQKPTFITSNLDPRKMTGQFHERIVKRLAELCVLVEVSGVPMRELMDAKLNESRWNGGAVHA